MKGPSARSTVAGARSSATFATDLFHHSARGQGGPTMRHMAEIPDLPFVPTIPELVRRATELHGRRTLIATPTGRATFAEVDLAARRLARRLIGSGVGKGTRVGLHFAYSVDFIVAWVAAARIGALVMPFSTSYAPGELRKALRRCDVSTFIVPRRMLGRDQLQFVLRAVPELDSASSSPLYLHELPNLRSVWVIGESDRDWARPIDTGDDASEVDDELLVQVEQDVTPADWLVVISTSGSTAEPKGVVHTHGSTVRKAAVPLMAGMGEVGPQVVFASMPLFWVGGLLTLTNALCFGNTMVCQERFSVDEALDLIEQERCTAVSAWLTITQALREHPSLPRRNLQHIPALTEPIASRPYGVPLGMTESMGPYMTLPHPDYGFNPPGDLAGSQGIASPYYDLRTVDAVSGETLTTAGGDGEGEMCLRGPLMLAGLYKREQHEVFDEDGYYHTGDRVRMEKGLYFFVGRVTEMIKTNGANVAPPEVEAVLESFPDVKFAFVFGIPDPGREEEVCAVVVPADGAVVDVGSLRSLARDELSSYKIPRRVIVMAEDDVPWLPTGKPDKRAMRTRVIAAAGAQPSP
ncbi:MAG TPA: long-chain fatty acid--CoA ligase [Acidimicrobiales bacterium]|nr:long-chain fatty acid--CoA ligase [Acidimicrobiales bacterium]